MSPIFALDVSLLINPESRVKGSRSSRLDKRGSTCFADIRRGRPGFIGSLNVPRIYRLFFENVGGKTVRDAFVRVNRRVGSLHVFDNTFIHFSEINATRSCENAVSPLKTILFSSSY